METKKLPDGTLIVPFADYKDGRLGDGYKKIKPGQTDYQKYLLDFKKQEELANKLREIAKKNPEYKDSISDW